MADPFGDKNKDADEDKRPAQTIEGTAEEVPSDLEASNDEQASAASEATSETEAASADGDAWAEDPETHEDEPADEERAAVPPPPSSGGGFLSHVLAGVIGGVIGVVALFLAVTYYPSLATRSAPELEARLDALESREPAASEVSAGDFGSLEDRVAKLESTIDSMADQAEKGGSVADAAAVSQQIDEAEQRLETKIDQRLADLSTGESQGSDTQAADAQQVANLRQQLDTLKSEVASLSQTQARENAGNAVDAADLDAVKQRVAKLESELPDLSSAVKQSSSEARSAALTASLADLRTAVQSGGPYKSELDDFKAIVPAGAELSPLPAHAAEGIATMPELIAAFEPARDQALATEVEPAEEGFFDTLLSSASSVVTVRRLDGAGEGNSTEAILTRARAALDEGDLDKAVREVEGLKQEPKQAMEDWLAAAKARTGTQATLKRLAGSDLAQSSDASPQADAPAASGL